MHLNLVKRFWEKKEMLAVGIATVIWIIWKTRNSACFEKNGLMDLVQ
jgi:hypothetical protein